MLHFEHEFWIWFQEVKFGPKIEVPLASFFTGIDFWWLYTTIIAATSESILRTAWAMVFSTENILYMTTDTSWQCVPQAQMSK